MAGFAQEKPGQDRDLIGYGRGLEKGGQSLIANEDPLRILAKVIVPVAAE
jgi:hypothetical protein